MRRKDLREIERRLEEVVFIAECGYDPVYDEALGEWLWVKCHWGSVHTHAGALEEHGLGPCPECSGTAGLVVVYDETERTAQDRAVRRVGAPSSWSRSSMTPPPAMRGGG